MKFTVYYYEMVYLPLSQTAIWNFLQKQLKVFFKISQYSQENTGVGDF